jgi:hypothetical protein
LKKFTTTCSRNIALFYRTNSDSIRKNIKIVDSTTISLFKDILKCVGRKAINGKKQRRKSHSVINADEKVPNLVWFSPATTHDHQFLENSNAMRIPFIYSIRDIMTSF